MKSRCESPEAVSGLSLLCLFLMPSARSCSGGWTVRHLSFSGWLGGYNTGKEANPEAKSSTEMLLFGVINQLIILHRNFPLRKSSLARKNSSMFWFISCLEIDPPIVLELAISDPLLPAWIYGTFFLWHMLFNQAIWEGPNSFSSYSTCSIFLSFFYSNY